jgi:alkylation response protein AidB-like acyl-CoA dehydrogenase
VVLHAPQAHQWLVSARTSGGTRDANGISLFVVDGTTPGITMTAYHAIDERRGADIQFENVRVPGDMVLGEIGRAYELIEDGVDYGAALLCAEAVGAMKYACDATLEYLKTRKQFGVPIGSFQALQHRMVDMVIEREQCLSMASLAVGASATSGAGRRQSVRAAASRLVEGCERVSQEAIQLHGGMGMTEELKVSHTFRRLTALRIELQRGTA